MHLTARVLALAAFITACGDNGEGNTPPTVEGMVLTTDEDTPLTRSFVITDNEGDPLTLSFSDPEHGTVGSAGADTFSYLPDADYHGLDSFTVTVSDGKDQTTATVQITVTPTNDAPTGGGDALVTNEDMALTTPASALLANDTDVDGDTLVIEAVGQSAHGFASLLNGTVTFVPEIDYAGQATFTYTVSDGTASSNVVVVVTVNPVNDAPFALDDVATTAENTPLVLATSAVVANDEDPDLDTLSVTAVSGASVGTVALAGTSITYTPPAGFSGNATFNYTVSDGALTDTGTVFVSVTSVNDAPVANADAVTTAEDTAIVVTQATLIANDTDADTGSTLAVTAAANPVNGTIAFAGGNVTFTPTANVHGTGSFQYTLSDGTATATGTVTVTITPVNDAPVAIDDVVTLGEDGVATLAALAANDLDIDGDALTVIAVTNATNGTVSLAGTTATFTPTANFAGAASFEYTVSDGTLTDTGTVNLVITAVNDPPVAVDDTATVAEDTPLVLAATLLAANDSDVDGTVTVTAVSDATNGSVALAGGNVTFTPAANFHGIATFAYTASDGSATDIGLVTVTVTSVNDVPVAVADSVTAAAGTPVDFPAAAFLANDTDVDLDTLQITAVANATNGATVSLAGTTVTFTAPVMFSGVATFEYTLADGNGGTATGSVSVGVDVTSICGDGIIAAATEACDDGDTTDGDGCSATCAVEAGYTCAGEPSACTTTCGDGVPAGTEACDDGNTTNGDGCDSDCSLTGCGNAIVTAGEACDDGDTDETDGCTSECSLGVLCNATAFAGGDRFAVDPFTGSCYVSFDGEQTTFAAARTACTAIGGYLATITSAAEQALVQGVQNPVENPWIGALDDANTTDAVFTWVTAEPFGFTAFDANEPDNDAALGGNGDCLHLNPNGLWADTSCTVSTFVTGRVCEIETQPCGDGVLQASEQCDDGNVTAGDGCSATCTFERYFIFTFTGAVGNEAMLPADTAPATLASAPVMTRGPGVTSANAANAFSAQNWATTFDPTDHFTFTITPATGITMDLNRFSFREQRSSSGPVTYVVRSSLDNFTADLATGATATSFATHAFLLPSQFQNLTAPVTFRIYAFGPTAQTGTFRIDDVEVAGLGAP